MDIVFILLMHFIHLCYSFLLTLHKHYKKSVIQEKTDQERLDMYVMVSCICFTEWTKESFTAVSAVQQEGENVRTYIPDVEMDAVHQRHYGGLLIGLSLSFAAICFLGGILTCLVIRCTLLWLQLLQFKRKSELLKFSTYYLNYF